MGLGVKGLWTEGSQAPVKTPEDTALLLISSYLSYTLMMKGNM